MGSVSNAIASAAKVWFDPRPFRRCFLLSDCSFHFFGVCRQSYGAEIVTNATVSKILYDERIDGGASRVKGVKMTDGTEIQADIVRPLVLFMCAVLSSLWLLQVLSNATPYHTFLELLPGLSRDSGNKDETSPLPRDFQHHIRFADYQVPAATSSPVH